MHAYGPQANEAFTGHMSSVTSKEPNVDLQVIMALL